jgi:sorbitol-specific phosphotransferase system component IIBC
LKAYRTCFTLRYISFPPSTLLTIQFLFHSIATRALYPLHFFIFSNMFRFLLLSALAIFGFVSSILGTPVTPRQAAIVVAGGQVGGGNCNRAAPTCCGGCTFTGQVQQAFKCDNVRVSILSLAHRSGKSTHSIDVPAVPSNRNYMWMWHGQVYWHSQCNG